MVAPPPQQFRERYRQCMGKRGRSYRAPRQRSLRAGIPMHFGWQLHLRRTACVSLHCLAAPYRSRWLETLGADMIKSSALFAHLKSEALRLFRSCERRCDPESRHA
jgi:hypothetical protein